MQAARPRGTILDRMVVYWGQRCGAKRRDGQRCGQWSLRGAYVCRMHGGSTKRVRAAAARRWQEFLAEQPVMKRALARMDQAKAEVEAIRRAAG